MDVVNGSLEEKMATGRDYDRVIQEAEQVGLILCQCDTQSETNNLSSMYPRVSEKSPPSHLILLLLDEMWLDIVSPNLDSKFSPL